MKYTMSCQDCDWKAEADKIAEVVDLMVEHQQSNDRHVTDYRGPKNSWGTLSWAKHAKRQQERLAAGRRRAKARRERQGTGLNAVLSLGLPEKKIRDTQQKKLYAAEDALPDLWERRFSSISEMQAYTDKIMRSRYVGSKYPSSRKAIVTVVAKGGIGGGRVHITWPHRSYEIWMTNRVGGKVYSEGYLLHEIAHVLTDFDRDYRGEAHHGRTYARTYLGLVKRFMGPDVEFGLKASFRAHGVKWAKRGRRAPMTPEEKAIVAKRLAAARQAKA